MKIILLALFFVVDIPSVFADTYEVVLKGKKCTENEVQEISCSYKVGESLFIEIAGIGRDDTGIAFLKSDFMGDYYGKFGMLHDCVIVNGKTIVDFAFISPLNGKVYRTWQDCKSLK